MDVPNGVLQHTVDRLALKKTAQTGPEDSCRTNLEAQRRDDDDHHNPRGGGIKVVKAFNMKHAVFIKPRYVVELESQIRQCLRRSETDNNKRPAYHDKKDVSFQQSRSIPNAMAPQRPYLCRVG